MSDVFSDIPDTSLMLIKIFKVVMFLIHSTVYINAFMEVIMPLFCDHESIVTESDVEQKFIYPFLTSTPPLGLGLDDSKILTKTILRQKIIGKGQKQKYYYPDYIISIRGIPVLVLEAKNPTENLAAAYSEARLYADEVNSGFPHNINTCQLIIVSNGTETWAGYSDHAEPALRLSFDDFCIENIKYVELLELCSKNKLEDMANKPYLDARGKAIFNTPVSQLGGNRVQNEELEENTFGRTFIFENRKIFDPETEEERGIIVENAYVPSAKREQHIEPIYREIRKFELPSKKNTTPLATSEPIELIQKISQRVDQKDEAYSLLLVVGNVGSGKSTFIRYFRRMFLEKQYPDLAKQCDWVFLNMNSAPLTNDEIYDWLKKEAIVQLQNNHSDIDFSSLEVIKKIFRKEIRIFETGIGRLLVDDKATYNKEIYDLLKAKIDDTSLYLESLLYFFKENYGSLPIIVPDNCDKRNKDEQLLMFQVAQWLRTTFKCIVILPMRDSTYDQYRDEPPLDTVVKDLVFRIDPPDLLKVIQARLDYIIRITTQTESTYMLQNGITVAIKKSELIEYFKCIMLTIRNNQMTSNIFYRLSDRNTRNGMQLFEDFCKSGHILANDIFMIRTTVTEYELPSYKFLNALLRKNRRYYNGEQSNFINLFYSSYSDDFPDPFIRIDILQWLKTNIAKEGPTKTKGMFPVCEIIRDTQIIGHNSNVVQRELNYLIKRGLIISESLMSSVSKNDLIKIALPGLLHLNLLSNVTYLAACSEDILFKNTTIMTTISRRIASSSYLSKLSMALTSNDMIQYLINYRSEFCSHPESYILNGDQLAIYDLSECKNAIKKWIDDDKNVKDWVTNLQTYQTGTRVVVEVMKKRSGGLVCRFGENQSIKGFISTHDAQYKLDNSTYEIVNENDKLECEIFEYDIDHKSFQLKYISRIV